jgi:hypothetical protein
VLFEFPLLMFTQSDAAPLHLCLTMVKSAGAMKKIPGDSACYTLEFTLSPARSEDISYDNVRKSTMGFWNQRLSDARSGNVNATESPKSVEDVLRKRFAAKYDSNTSGIDSSDVTPLYLTAAQRCATRTGVNVEQVLRNDLEWMRHSKYPSPTCFEPHEIELALINELSPARQQHADDCRLCEALLAASRKEVVLPEPLREEILIHFPLALAYASRGIGSYSNIDAYFDQLENED